MGDAFTRLFSIPKVADAITKLPSALELSARASEKLLRHLVDKTEERRFFGEQPTETVVGPGMPVRSANRISCGRRFSVVANPALCDMIPAQTEGYWLYSGGFTPGAARYYTARATDAAYTFDGVPDPSNIMTIYGGSGFTHPFTLPPEGFWVPQQTPVQIGQSGAAIWCAFNCIVSRFPSF